MQLSYHAITSYGGIEPPYEVAIPPQAASAEPGDSRVLVEPGDIQFQPLIVEQLDSPPESSSDRSSALD